jgi:ATP-binding cassette subfamily B protein
VSLRGISFEYEPGRPVLSSVETDVPRGSTVAVVGATGAGKTTLLQIIAGLLPASAGEVARDGDCCLVFQEPFLFASSLADNVTLGDDYGTDAVRDALDLAEASEFVDQLEAGVDTVIGERGVSLSGGQRQRIALARALVRKPKVLLLDDTTSALDPGTEARILGNLRRGLSGVTTIVVASRPSTIALADEVVYLDGGRVVARGPHEQLVREIPAYRVLVDAYETDRSHLAGDTPPAVRQPTAARA